MKRKNLCLLISFILSNIFTITSCNNEKENLVIGDSLLSGYGLEKKDIIISALKDNVQGNLEKFIEIGLTLSSFSKNLNRFENKKYNYVFIELGANDFLLNIDVSTTEENLKKIINYFQKYSEKIFFISFIDSTMYNIDDERKNLLNSYKKVFDSLKSEGVILIENIWNGKFLDSEYKIDLYHPSEIGTKLIAENIINQL